MIVKLKATVSWSAEVEVNVPENASEWEKRDAIYAAGEEQLQELSPVITECDDPSLEE
jgi:hypothetical protein